MPGYIILCAPDVRQVCAASNACAGGLLHEKDIGLYTHEPRNAYDHGAKSHSGQVPFL